MVRLLTLCFVTLTFSMNAAYSAAADDGILSKPITCCHPSSGYATADIGVSKVYSSTVLDTKGPLQVTQIHTYDPALHPTIAFRIPKASATLPDFLADYRTKNFDVFVVVDRPVYDAVQPLCLRPHYVVYPAATSAGSMSSDKHVFVHDGTTIRMNQSANVHIHDNVCSPSNMHMAWIDLSSDALTYTVFSAVQLSATDYAITLHYIPTQRIYDGVMALLTKDDSPIKTVKDLLSTMSVLAVADATSEAESIAARGPITKILSLLGKDLTSLD